MDIIHSHKSELIVSSDQSRLDLEVIHQFLSGSYWAEGRSKHTVALSIENSLCYGAYWQTNFVGFARVLTDFSTIAILLDVFVIEPLRGNGIASFLIECILANKDLQTVKWSLNTKDAQGLYEKFNFRINPPKHTPMIRDPSELHQLNLGNQ